MLSFFLFYLAALKNKAHFNWLIKVRLFQKPVAKFLLTN